VVKTQKMDGRPISSLPCALDETLLELKPPDNIRFDDPTNKRRVILTVARLDPSERYKGHDVVLRSLRTVIERFPDLLYTIVGDGRDRARLESLCSNLGVL